MKCPKINEVVFFENPFKFKSIKYRAIALQSDGTLLMFHPQDKKQAKKLEIELKRSLLWPK